MEPDELDAGRFERLVDDGRHALQDGRPDDAAGILNEALALWRGPPRNTILALTGPRGIGKTRLAAEFAQEAHLDGATVLYASGPAAIAALSVSDATRPLLVVTDDADRAAPSAVRALAHVSPSSW